MASNTTDRKEWFPDLNNLKLGETYPYQAAISQRRLWEAVYYLRSQLQVVAQASSPVNASAVPVVSGTSTLTSQPAVVPSGAIIVVFNGTPIVLSSGPFEVVNPISGAYLRELYNNLNTIPNSWNMGCVTANGSYVWPIYDSLPVDVVNGGRMLPSGATVGVNILIAPDGIHYAGTDDVCPGGFA